MENDLFKKFLNQLTDEDLRKVVLSQKINIVGFRITPETLKLVPSVKLKSGIEDHIRTTNIKGIFNTKEDYNKLREKNVVLFNFRILYDLYKNINVEIINSLLSEIVDENIDNITEQKFINNNLVKDKEENNKLRIENSKLIKNIKSLEKQLKQKNEDFVKQQNLSQKEKAKIELENKRLKEQIQYLNNNISELKDKNMEKDSEMELLKEKMTYYTSLINLKKILLFKLKPIDENIFPYSYISIDKVDEIEMLLNDEKFTDLWYPMDALNPFIINRIIKILKLSYTAVNIRALDKETLELLKIGVEL